MLWSEWIELTTSGDLPTFETVSSLCDRISPSGHWALSSDLDNYLLWKSNGQEQLPPAPASTIYQLIDDYSVMKILGYSLIRKNNNNSTETNGSRLFT